MHILIINPFGIGDVLFTIPLIRNLKYFYPQTHIGYLCNERVSSLLTVQPDIDSVYIFEKDEWRKKFRKSKLRALRDFYSFLKGIKSMGFDIAIDLSLAPEFSFTLWLLGIKNRLGYDYKKRGFFINRRIKLQGYSEKHIVEYYNDLLKLFKLEPRHFPIKIDLPSNILNWAEDELSALRAKHSIIISVIPGGGSSWGSEAYKKLWPQKNYRALVELINKEIPAGVLLLGDKNDAQIFPPVESRDSLLNYMGKTTLLESAGLISKSDLVVANDGGLLHLAVSLNIPTLSIFGPVSEKIYGPYPPSKLHKVLSLELECRPCYKNFKTPKCDHYSCLKKLDVDFVFQELKKHLSFVLSQV